MFPSLPQVSIAEIKADASVTRCVCAREVQKLFSSNTRKTNNGDKASSLPESSIYSRVLSTKVTNFISARIDGGINNKRAPAIFISMQTEIRRVRRRQLDLPASFRDRQSDTKKLTKLTIGLTKLRASRRSEIRLRRGSITRLFNPTLPISVILIYILSIN